MAEQPMDMETQLQELREQFDALKKSVGEETRFAAKRFRRGAAAAGNSASRIADDAIEYARDEAVSMGDAVRGHPAAASTALLAAGAIGCVIGFMLGTAASASNSHWR